MSQLVGADPAALDGFSELLHTKATRLSGMQESSTAAIAALAWEGGVAYEFQTVWALTQAPRFNEAAAFLTAAAQTLTRHAAEQRAASAGPQLALQDQDSTDFAATVRDRLVNARFALEGTELALLLKIGNRDTIEWFLSNADLFRVLTTVASGGSLISDFLTDAVQNPHLPTDERIVHAISETGLRYAAEKGISQAMQWTGSAVAGLLTAGVGLVAGRAIGWLIGEALGSGFRYLDDEHGVTDTGADALTDFYRDVRDEPEDYLRMLPVVGPALPGALDTWELATELAPSLEHGADDLAESVGETTTSLGEAVDDIIDGTARRLGQAPPVSASTW